MIIIENEIYCYVNDFLKWNFSKETSYIVGNKKLFGKTCILNLRNKFLFTNILLQETIDVAINLIFNHNPNLNITGKELKKLFLFATSQTHLIFNIR